jgi:hypothetical protein
LFRRLGQFRRSRIEPFGVAEVREREVRLLILNRVSVDPECQRWVCVAELIGDPTHALSCCECERGPRVSGAVELEGSDALLLCSSAQPFPHATKMALVPPSLSNWSNKRPTLCFPIWRPECPKCPAGYSLYPNIGSDAAVPGDL